MSQTSFISDEEARSLVIAACESRPHTEEEIKKIIHWANGVRMDESLLGMVLDKKLLIQWAGDEPSFKSKP